MLSDFFMGKLYTSSLQTAIGWLEIITDDFSLRRIAFVDLPSGSSEGQPQILLETIQQLEAYFAGKRKTFHLDLRPEGTEFQKKTWDAVREVEYGKTATYLEIALKTGSKNNTRAVGLANGKNPLPIVVPCHRIIGSNGKLTGYSGGLDKKRWLLLHEKNHSQNEILLF